MMSSDTSSEWWDDGLDVDALDAMVAQVESVHKTKIGLVVAYDANSGIVYRWAAYDVHVALLMDALNEIADVYDLREILLDSSWNLSWPSGRSFVVPERHEIYRIVTVDITADN